MANTDVASPPEEYFLKPNVHCPNNVLPVLVYRRVLSEPLNEDAVSESMQKYGWEKRVCRNVRSVLKTVGSNVCVSRVAGEPLL